METSMDVKCSLGTWLDSAVRNTPRGKIIWRGLPRRVYTAGIGERGVLGTVRRSLNSGQWVASIPGFLWDVSGDRGSTTTEALGITQLAARAFDSSEAGKKAIEEAYRDLLTAVDHQDL